MFNAEIKEKYLTECSNSVVSRVIGLFLASETIEKSVCHDLACFSVNELQQFFELLGFMEPDVVRTRLGLVASYADWYCILHNLSGHHIREYKVNMFPYAKYFAPTIIKTPEELLQNIAVVYHVETAQSVIPALCMAWLGVDLDDAIRLPTECVDVKAGKIYSANGSVIAPDMPDCIRKLLQEYSTIKTSERTKNQTYPVYADDLGFFIKRMVDKDSKKVGQPISTKSMRAWITIFNDKLHEQLPNSKVINYTNVQRSGNFYRLHQMDQAGVDVRAVKNADKVRLCLGKSKRNHKDNMLLYDAYLQIIGEK